jgi:hypothetical protein
MVIETMVQAHGAHKLVEKYNNLEQEKLLHLG